MDTAVASELLAGIATRDFARIETCFAEDAVLRALTPHQLREERGAAAIAAQYGTTPFTEAGQLLETLAIDLAVRQPRQFGYRDKRRRHHVSG